METAPKLSYSFYGQRFSFFILDFPSTVLVGGNECPEQAPAKCVPNYFSGLTIFSYAMVSTVVDAVLKNGCGLPLLWVSFPRTVSNPILFF